MEQEQSKINHVIIRGVILIGFTILLSKLVITGDLKNFIAPKMAPLTYFSIAAFLLMGIAQFLRNKNGDDIDCDCGSDHGTSDSGKRSIFIYSLFIVPLLTGMFFSNNTLDSTFAANRGVNFGEKTASVNQQTATQKKTIAQSQAQATSTSNASETAQPTNTSQEASDFQNEYDNVEKNLLSSKKIVVNDDYFIFTMNTIMQKVDQFVGKEIEFVGFVFKPDGFPNDQINVSRFGVSCCIADSDIIGMLSIGNVSSLKQDEWIKVDGTIEKYTYQGTVLPSLKIKSIEKVPKLNDPYVYFKY